AADRIVDRGRIHNRDARATAEGDGVARACGGAADLVVVGAGGYEHADAVDAERGRTGGAGADGVAHDHVAGRARQEGNLGAEAIGDDVAGAESVAANDVIAAPLDGDPLAGGAQGQQAGDVGADEVALDRVAAAVEEPDADAVAAGDEVARPGGRAADEFP